jgi:hypothetical protein
MPSFTPCAHALALVALCASPAVAAPAQIFVSGKGTDSVGCGAPASPCRTFQFAHDAVATGGVVAAMDSGDYGTLRIVKSVSVVNNGAGVAAIAAGAGKNAIEIALAAPGKVFLRGLTVDGGKVAGMGLLVPDTSEVSLTLDISKCVFRNFLQSGVALGGFAKVSFAIADTESSDNGVAGLSVLTPAASDGTIVDSRFNRNRIGFWSAPGMLVAPAGLVATFRNVEAIGNETAFYATGNDSKRYDFTLTNVNFSGPNVMSAGVASVRLSRSTLVHVKGNYQENGDWLTSSGDNQGVLFDRALPIPLAPMK